MPASSVFEDLTASHLASVELSPFLPVETISRRIVRLAPSCYLTQSM